MLNIWLIRHGMTEGNKIGRYIGVTDEPLSPEGMRFLEKLTYQKPQALFVSPMVRCRETAQILFPNQNMRIIDELSECDFGDFENKNYQELSDNPDYQAWVDSNGLLPFPNGESRESFKRRSLLGFQKAVTSCIRNNVTEATLVIHGGTIMNIMEEYAVLHRPFYQWHVKNGGGYQISIDPAAWQKGNQHFMLRESILES